MNSESTSGVAGNSFVHSLLSLVMTSKDSPTKADTRRQEARQC